jgi:hypothetical protein
MLILIPIMSYAGAALIVNANLLDQLGIPLSSSPELMRARSLNPIPQYLTIPVDIPVVEHLFANLMVAVVLMMLGFAIVMVIYALLYRVMGPSQLGPMDAKPIRRKPRGSRPKPRRHY